MDVVHSHLPLYLRLLWPLAYFKTHIMPITVKSVFEDIDIGCCHNMPREPDHYTVNYTVTEDVLSKIVSTSLLVQFETVPLVMLSLAW